MRLCLAGTALLVASVFSSTASAQEDTTVPLPPYFPPEMRVTAPKSPAPTDEVVAVADEAGVDPVDLQGAVNTTGVPAKEYVYSVGDLQRPQPAAKFSATTAAAPAAYGVWDRLAACESTSNWRANTGNGYYGGLQEDMAFWRNHGGMAYANRPDLASREAQIAVAQTGLAAQGWGAWPNCSRRLGLR